MKHLYLLFMCLSLSMCIASPAFAQTGAQQYCQATGGLEWEMNAEADMEKYTIYHSTSPTIVMGADGVFAFDVIHDPDSAIPNPDEPNSLLMSTVFPITFPDGIRYFAISASDKAKNQSGLSNEVNCVFDTGTPSTPILFLRFK